MGENCDHHYGDVILSEMASQINSLTIVYSTVYSNADRRKHQSSASLASMWGIHRWPVNSPHKGPVTRKMLPFDDVIILRLHINKKDMYRSAMQCVAWWRHVMKMLKRRIHVITSTCYPTCIRVDIIQSGVRWQTWPGIPHRVLEGVDYILSKGVPLGPRGLQWVHRDETIPEFVGEFRTVCIRFKGMEYRIHRSIDVLTWKVPFLCIPQIDKVNNTWRNDKRISAE